MQAIALTPATKEVHLTERKEPMLTAPDEIKLRVLEVGICGTDREEAAGFRGTPAPGEKDLVLGHEMFGQVVEVGPKVSAVKPGDYAVFTVRRGCGHCAPCAMNHSDMCYTGDYIERGIKERDGYQTELVVDTEQYVVKIPDDIKHIGVLAEPTSVAEKAISEAVRIQISRLPDATDPSRWLEGRQVLVAGLGPIGLLAAFALRLRGAEVIGLDVVDAGTNRPKLLEEIGGRYVDGREIEPDKIDDKFGHIDLIFEATGVARLQFNLLGGAGRPTASTC